MLRLAAPLIVVCLSACSPSLPATVVTPKDPTPLAKCSVAKSNARPLVTEWPASEKAHLEGLLSSQAVAVKYSGCEMQILDACRIPGTYGFQRTTISNDTIEITDADELYAKIPLGAAGLEGELSSSGRLAIDTTVVGQLRLETDVAVPDTSACRGVTHVIHAISVGAFEMTSGGAVSGRVGVDVGNAGAGVGSSSSETSLKSSGDRESCRETGDEGPHVDCRSPLQVFLRTVDVGATVAGVGPVSPEPAPPEPIEPSDDDDDDDGGEIEDRPERVVRPAPPPPPPPAPKRKPKPWDEPPADEAVTVEFAPPAGTGAAQWKVLSREGDVLCDALPCTRRVGPSPGMQLQLDAPRKEDILVFPVPNDLGYSPGRKVRAVPDMKEDAWIWPAVMTGVGAGAIGAGAALIVTGQCDDEDLDCSNTTAIIGYVVGGTGLTLAVYGVLGLLGSGEQTGPGELEITLVDDASARLRVTPSGVGFRF